MGIFDNYNYEINRRLPEFWKSDIFLTPIERFSSILMRDTVQRFMEKMGVLQPFMVWKTLPEEYHWEYAFSEYDIRLASKQENPNCNQTLLLSENNHIVAQLPLTKRNVHAYIIIELSSLSFSDATEFTKISELVIKNADQTLKIKDIDSKTTIEIYTEENKILINDTEPKANQVEGSIDIIKRVARDDPKTITDPLDMNEKCELEIFIPNGESAYCNLFTRLYYPVYVAEQNIRVFSISAFPIEYVRLYGYMCHKYNNNHQWVYLYEKTYAYQDRIVYDRITKQYDCEIFYIEVKLYGLPAPIFVGFPASYADSTEEGVFTLNDSLDYWGSIFHIPRRLYKTDIPEEDERYCFPKYYEYPVEQDYPYEQRLINEYKYNEDWEDYINIRDTEGNDLALVRCKDPYIENLYMYTETIPPVNQLNSQATFLPTCVKQINTNNDNLHQGEWEHEINLRTDDHSYSIISLDTQDEEHVTDKSYKANTLALEYDLTSLPENCKIKGIQIKFKGASNTHADNIFLDNRSILKYTQKIKNNVSGDHDWSSKEIPLTLFWDEWRPDNSTYVLGDKNSIFYNINDIEEIDRDSIEKGYLKNGLYQTNKIRIDIGFTNVSDYLELIIKLYNIKLIVYYELLKEDIDMKVSIPHRTIIYDDSSDETTSINVNMDFVNQGEMQEIGYNVFVIIPSELKLLVDEGDEKISYYVDNTATLADFKLGELTSNNYVMDEAECNILHIDEEWKNNLQITAKKVPTSQDPSVEEFKSGRYDITFICGKQIITEEVYVYDMDFAIRTKYKVNTETGDKTLLYFANQTITATTEGNATLTLYLVDNHNPIPNQYITIEGIGTDIEKHCITNSDGKISVDVQVDTTTTFQATYANLTAKCDVVAPSVKVDLYDVIQEKEVVKDSKGRITKSVADVTYLSSALLEQPTSNSVSTSMTKLSNKQSINQNQLGNTILVGQYDQSILDVKHLTYNTQYAILFYATVLFNDNTAKNIKYTCFFNSAQLTTKNSTYSRIYVSDDNGDKIITDLKFTAYT